MGTGFCSPWAGEDSDKIPNEDDQDSTGAGDIALVALDPPGMPTIVDVAGNPVPTPTVPWYIANPLDLGLPYFEKSPLNDSDSLSYDADSRIVGFGTSYDSDEYSDFWVRDTVPVRAYLRKDPCSWYEFSCSDTAAWFMNEKFGSGSSNGDSGGPLFHVIDGQETQIGVSSYDHSPPIGRKASVYAPVAFNIETSRWINSFLQKNAWNVLDSAAFATDKTKVNDRATVDGNGTVAGSTVEVGADAVVEGNAMTDTTATLRERSRVDGDVSGYRKPSSQSGTTATWSPGPALFSDTLANLTACFSPGMFLGGEDRIVGPSTFYHPIPTTELFPGQYGSVRVERGATLILSGPGDYYFEEFRLESESTFQVLVSDPLNDLVRIYVKGTVILRGVNRSNTNSVLLAAMVPEQGNRHIHIDMNGAMTVVAPESTAELAPGRNWYGSIFAKWIELHQDTTLTYNPFPGDWCP